MTVKSGRQTLVKEKLIEQRRAGYKTVPGAVKNSPPESLHRFLSKYNQFQGKISHI